MALATIQPFLMFQGDAEEAMNFYVSLFEDGKVIEFVRYGPQDPGREGSVKKAAFVIGGQTVHCIDSAVPHEFTFTPALSLLVECVDQEQLDRLYRELCVGGKALMPLGSYGFSRRFAWLNDRFGVSWQLNLA